MDAWHLPTPLGTYEFGAVVDPPIGADDVCIRVVASALNHMDLWLTQGLPHPPRFPHVPGNDVAGIVESVGPAVTGWSVGDEVVVNTCVVPAEALSMGIDSVLHPGMQLLGEARWGGHGELCVVPAHNVVAKPAGTTWAEAAAYPICYSTVWRLLRRCRLDAGSQVLVTGIGGGVATAAMMIAVDAGAEVFVTSRDAAKRGRATDLGAADAFDSAEPYPVEVDIVVDSIGPATWDHAIRALRPGGRMGVCGGTSGPTVELHLPRLFFKQLEIIGATGGSQVEFEELTTAIDKGLPVLVDDVVALADYPAAIERLRGSAQFGKIVLQHDQ